MKLRGFLVCVAPMVGGIIVGAKTPLLSPLLYALSRVNKSICLVGFIVYCLAICFEVYVNSVYSIDYTTVFAIVLPNILLLDRCLSERDYDTVELAITPFVLLGLISREVFVVSVSSIFLYNFWRDKPKLGVIVVSTTVFVLVMSLTTLSGVLGLKGGASSQVAFIGAVLALATAIWIRLLSW